MDHEFMLSAYLAEAVELLERGVSIIRYEDGLLASKIFEFLQSYKQELS